MMTSFYQKYQNPSVCILVRIKAIVLLLNLDEIDKII